MRKLFVVLFVCLAVSVFAQNANQHKIYILGSYVDDSNNERACYWIDGERHELSGTQARVYSMAVSEDKVYVSGQVRDKFPGHSGTYADGTTYMPCYWVDGVRNNITLPGGIVEGMRNNSRASFYVTLGGIGVLNKNVYIGIQSMEYNRYGNAAARDTSYWYGYWVNNAFTSTSGKSTRAIAIEDGIAYIAFNQENPVQGGYTVYGQSILLGANTSVNDIAVEGGEVLITGSYRDGSKFRDGTEIDKPCVWIDGNRVPLPLHQNYTGGYAAAIAVEGVDTVILGGYTDGSRNSNNRLIYKGCYWVDAEFKEIPASDSYSDVALLDGVTYIVGYFNRGGIWMACYWVNGERNIIPYGRTASKIIVTKK